MLKRFTRRAAFVPGAVVVVLGGLSFVACPAPNVPSPEDGAFALGLESDRTKTYASSNGATETHEYSASDLLFGGGIAVDVQARENGFAKNDRTLTFGIDVAQASLLRFNDCLQDCATADAPIPFINWPLTSGSRVEGEATVSGTEGGVDFVRTERHTTTVGTPAELTVPFGTFDEAFPVTWSRTRIDPATGDSDTEQALLHWVADVGIVKYETFDGATLELSEDR